MAELKAPEGYSLGAFLTVDQLGSGQHFLNSTGHHWRYENRNAKYPGAY